MKQKAGRRGWRIEMIWLWILVGFVLGRMTAREDAKQEEQK